MKNTQTQVDADNPDIVYTGRIDFTNPKSPAFAFPGITIEACFEGSRISVLLVDSGSQNYYNVSIDNREVLVIRTEKGTHPFPIAEGLADCTHTIRIYKRTEALCGTTRFIGFLLDDGKTLVPLKGQTERRIEFIGDSITCGYGNMVSTNLPDFFPFTPQNENSEIAWGALTAKELNARFLLTAYSGRGLFRNYDGTETGTVPELYDTIFPDTPTLATWNPTQYIPDIIIINLGTNDYNSRQTKRDLSKKEFDAKFSTTYRTFIARLRKLYGIKNKIVCAVGPMLTDICPLHQKSRRRIEQTTRALVRELHKTGDSEVYYLQFDPQSAPFGEDWHPSAKTHKKMAKTTVAFLRQITGW